MLDYNVELKAVHGILQHSGTPERYPGGSCGVSSLPFPNYRFLVIVFVGIAWLFVAFSGDGRGVFMGEQWSTGWTEHTAFFRGRQSLDFCGHTRFLIDEGL